MDQAPIKQNSLSPKWAFVFGILVGLFVCVILVIVVVVDNPSVLPTVLKSNTAPTKTTEQGNQQPTPSQSQGMESKIVGPVGTFYEVSEPICKKDGKPIVLMFSTSWCPHCNWARPMFQAAVKDYVKAGKIVAHEWDLDTNDDTLTAAKETSVPAEDMALYNQYNPDGTIPTFVFGCKYYRIGTGHEQTKDTAAEEKEFKDIIDKLLK